MNSGLPSDRRGTVYAFLFALLTVAARLPFLATGKIAFDSDEAVEGLMARHVLEGELPAFLWGQAFKGVPEVYAAAGAFAIFGSSVTVLKSVTLAFFALFVALNFLLLDRMLDRWMAAAACLLLIACPPALVFWSLDASAEFVLVMLLGTAFLLLLLRADDSQLTAHDWPIGVVTGLGLWVHQLFWIYLIPAIVILVLRSEWWQRRDFGVAPLAAKILAAVAVLYGVLAIVAFLTGGFDVHLGAWQLGVRAPQKMLRIGFALAGLAALAHAVANVPRDRWLAGARRYRRVAAGFAVGYSPVILYTLLVEPARSPMRVSNAWQLIHATPDILGNIIPILAGFKIATTERLDIPVAAAAIIFAALMMYIESIHGRLMEFVRLRPRAPSVSTDFFPLFFVFVPLLFVIGGVYLDTQSYRYLVPYYAGLAVALASGSLTLAKGDRRIASVFVGMMIVVFALQQFVWFGKLAPDVDSARVVDCLRREGKIGGYADYWTSYKLTFLSGEDIIVAPNTGVDRYPAYTRFVRALPDHQRFSNLPNCDVSP